jgi:hypothetical protein
VRARLPARSAAILLLAAAPPAAGQQRDLASWDPPAIYQQARALALAGRDDSALVLLTRLAREGAVAATHTLFLSSFYERKIVAVAADGTFRDFIPSAQDGIGPVGHPAGPRGPLRPAVPAALGGTAP